MHGFKAILIIFFQVCSVTYLSSQSLLSGVILDDNKKPLSGVQLVWKSQSFYAITDSTGHFEIRRNQDDSVLVISYIGYTDKELKITSSQDQVQLTLNENIELQQVEVKSKRSDTYVSSLSNTNKEVITSRELRKAPCCNLSESFETSAVVDANYTNAALGTREIEMLGLRGIYSQVMIDSRPTMYNFATPFAFDFIPGQWLKAIQVSKGAGTVVNGSDGLAGQINVDLIDPQNGPKLLLNGYANHRARYEGNLVTNKVFNEHWALGTLAHASSEGHHSDANQDGFLDEPRKKQINLMERVHFQSRTWEGQINVHGIYDHREGGQTHHPSIDHKDPLLTYDHTNQRLEIFGNIGFLGFKDPDRSIGFQWHIQRHEYDASYARQANGTDVSSYTNLIYQEKFGSKDHLLLSGISMRRSNTREGFSDFIFDRNEFIPGIFSEYSYHADTKDTKFGFTSGLRMDKFGDYGARITPRFSMRYQVEDYGTIRASAGRAYRMPNIISDNIHFIGLGRYMTAESIGLDVANNYGLSYNQKIFLGGPFEWNISADFYHTFFLDQNIQDIESLTSKIINRYVRRGSRINYFLLQNQFQVNEHFGFKLAYKYTDAKYRLTNNSDLLDKLYLPRNRGLVTIDYNADESKWITNLTFQIVGPQRLLDISYYPTQGSQGHQNISPTYLLVNWHISYAPSKFEVYTGIENLGNYTQKYSIVSPAQALSSYFDATRLYAPTMGIRWYAGFKFRID